MPRSLCLFCLTMLRIGNCQLTSSDVLVIEVLQMDRTVDASAPKTRARGILSPFGLVGNLSREPEALWLRGVHQ